MRVRARSAMLLPVALVASLSLAACARQISGNVVEGPSTGEVMRTELGYIESARPVRVQESDRLEGNTAGALIGGATGGFLGYKVGGGWGRVLTTGVGALAGAAAGAYAQKGLSDQTGMEYVFRNEIGELKTIVQGPEPRLYPGQRAYLQIAPHGRARLVPG